MINNKHELHMIGNAHIDPVWLWRWGEGLSEVKATFRSALDRMKEFPEFIFTSACARYYKWIEEQDPLMFEEIRQRVAEGRWCIAGGWWIQPDCNIPSGESFARQGLYAQRYFFEKFGRIAKVGYNVDSFGHNSGLPQILKLSGLEYYVMMRPGETEKELPANLFIWEGSDGSQVMTYRLQKEYCSKDVDEMVSHAKVLMSEQQTDFMSFYGVGNHGGGPTIKNLEAVLKQQEVSETPILFSDPQRYFETVANRGYSLPVVRDDLQHHASGCYSLNHEVKAFNRKAEQAMINAEKSASLASVLAGYIYPHNEITRAWENLMFNQFHDILAGCSIKSAYEDAANTYGYVLHTADSITQYALQTVSWRIDTTKGLKMTAFTGRDNTILSEQNGVGIPLIVFNPHSWELETTVQVNRDLKSIFSHEGEDLPIQMTESEEPNWHKHYTLFKAKIPPMGYRLYWLHSKLNDDTVLNKMQKLSYIQDNNFELIIENKIIKLCIDNRTGNIQNLINKLDGYSWLKEHSNKLVVIEDDSNTWSHKKLCFRDDIGEFQATSVEIIEEGPVRWCIRVCSEYGRSNMTQDYLIYRDMDYVDIKVRLDWHGKHKMLKHSFKLDIGNPKVLYEIPYGVLERPANGEEEPGQLWLAVDGMKDSCSYGLGIANNSKYSADVKENEIRITAVRSPIYVQYEQPLEDFKCEYTDQGEQEYVLRLIPYKGTWQDSNTPKLAYELNRAPVSIIETYHEGKLPVQTGFISIDSDNVIATVLKVAEDGDGYILRCHEICNKAADTVLELPFLNRKWQVTFRPQEIKTFKIPFEADNEITEVNLLELDFDKRDDSVL